MDTDYPDRLEVLVASGSGTYTLHEGEGDAWAHTQFESKGEAGKQTLTFTCPENGVALPRRTYRFKFLNVPTGAVTVTANGKPLAAEVDDNRRLTVTLDGVEPSIRYEICVTYEKKPEEERDVRLFETLRTLEGNNLAKMALWTELAPLSREERAEKIAATALFTARGKKRLLEVLYSL